MEDKAIFVLLLIPLYLVFLFSDQLSYIGFNHSHPHTHLTYDKWNAMYKETEINQDSWGWHPHVFE